MNWTPDLWIPLSDAQPLSHSNSAVSKGCYEIHMTSILHTARINNVDSVSLESLWLSGRAIGAWNLNVWGLIPHGDSEIFLCPMLMIRWKTSFSIPLPSSKLILSLILFISNTINQIIVRKQYDVICNVISYKFKCTTVKIAFTTEDDIRMSKHVLQTKSCGFFIKN